MKKSYPNETKFEQDFSYILDIHGWEALKMENVRKGFPDRMYLSPTGDVFFIEFKNPNGTGKLSPSQDYWQDRLNSLGHKVTVISTVEEANSALFHMLGADYVQFKMGSSRVSTGGAACSDAAGQRPVSGSRPREDVRDAIHHEAKYLGGSTEGPSGANVDGRKREMGIRTDNQIGGWYTP